ncbi:MAG: sulfite exporter TauE/SafE family protein [Chloroflexi bacterium]|nr:sulfite exporter TauE/SafE family protein [Chloroflexota bacterium]MDA8218791.1 sulfite exporter TauE/SafE family protein [Dehalococcoidales bacterium]
MFEFLIAGISTPWALLVFTGFTVGVVGGFIGVGGGYMVTPALVVFGFPGHMAAGIDITHIAGKGVIASIRHRQLGNIDWTLAMTVVSGTMFGVEMGVRILDYFKEQGLSTVAVLTASFILMTGLFIYTQYETRSAARQTAKLESEGHDIGREVVATDLPRHLQRIPLAPIIRLRTARVVISLWVIVLVGMFTGTLAGFLGVGGGFIAVPALVYLIGATTHVAVGSDLVQIIFSGSYGALRHTMEGNVDFLAVMFMLCGAVFGAQFGSIATAYVRGPAIRFILSYSLALAGLGALFPLINQLTGSSIPLLSALAVTLTLGQMIFLCTYILSLLTFALLARRGRWVPIWALPFLVRYPVARSRPVQAAQAVPVQEVGGER